MPSTQLLTNATATGAGAALALNSAEFTIQATGRVSTSTGAATIKIQVSNDNATWIDLGTISLTLGTSVVTDGLAAFAKWLAIRANVTALSGTGASVNVTVNQA